MQELWSKEREIEFFITSYRKEIQMINKVTLVGRLGRDPEMQYSSGGLAICKFSMATTDYTKDKTERTEWHNCTAFGRMAEICGQYLSKGKQVYVEGRIQTREWEDKDGNRRWTTEIIADTVQFLSQASGGHGQAQSSQPRGNITRKTQPKKSGYPADIADQMPDVTDEMDDIPF